MNLNGETWSVRISYTRPKTCLRLSHSFCCCCCNQVWNERVSYYKRLIGLLPQGRYRNVMDANAYLGGFAAALSKYPVWVMNVVPANNDPGTLGVIYERGFIGTYNDWCEAFSTYPRTYDLIHAGGLISLYQDR